MPLREPEFIAPGRKFGAYDAEVRLRLFRTGMTYRGATARVTRGLATRHAWASILAVTRVGYVTSSSRSVNVDAFDQGLRELGYTIGQDIIVEYRFGEGQPSDMPALVDELLRLKVDVLFAPSPLAIRTSRESTNAALIVGIDLETNPAHTGWVASSLLSRADRTVQ